MEGFFDEKSGKWIRILKGVIIAEFWLMIAAAAVMCIMGWAEELYWTESAFIDGILALVAGCVGALIFLVPNMLILQLLNNIQMIREKLEESKETRTSKQQKETIAPPKPVFSDNGTVFHTQTTNHTIAHQWVCKNCGMNNKNEYGQCKNCGEYRK